MQPKQVPRTLALIPDGNRRWAKTHRLSIFNGYNSGVKKFLSFSEWCLEYGINNMVVWAFSTENFNRSGREQNTLFSIYKNFADDKSVREWLHKYKVKIRIIGNMALLPDDLKKALGRMVSDTMAYQDRVINILIGYGGRDDLIHAVKGAVKSVKNKAVISEKMVEKYLLTSSIPAIDFVIRTSGEHRLSGFMPWQTEYSELYFSKKLWPDFTKKDLHNALQDYSRRQRRFGK